MSTTATRPTLSPRAQQALRELLWQVQRTNSANLFWERCLTQHDRDCLGDDASAAYRRYGTAGIWAKLRGTSEARALIEVGRMLGFLSEADSMWLLREIGESSDALEAIDQATLAGALVLTEQPREAYWNGQPIDVDWEKHDALWVFLLKLAQRAKAGLPIDACVFGEQVDPDIVTKRKSRLRALQGFPRELSEMIEVVGVATQQLVLPPERIRIFEVTGSGELREWIA